MSYTMDLSDIDRFKVELCEQERSKATVKKYCRELFMFYSWLPADKQVDKACVIAYKAELITKYAPASVNGKLAALRGFFHFCRWEDCCVRLLKLQRRVFANQERELSKTEYERLVDTAENHNDHKLALALQIMASTGIRVSEMQYITVESVMTGRAEISLKGKIRVILLPERLCRKLLKYAKKEKITSGQIILTRSGRPMNRKELWAKMKSLCKEANVAKEKVFPHNLRHLFARSFYQSQRDIAKLADLLGHSNIETTRIYLLSSGIEHRRDIERLGLVC